MVKFRFPFMIMFCLVNLNLMAQSKINFFEGNLTINKATGFFGKNIKNINIGIEGGYLRQLKLDNPIFWGISIYYFNLGKSGTYTIQEQLDLRLVNFDYSTESQLLGFNGKMRFYPAIHLAKAELYIESQLGYKWLYTTTTKIISDESNSSDTNIETGNLSLTYGASMGLNYPITSSLYLNLRGNYLPGLSKPYYAPKLSNQIQTSTLDLFELKRSTTDLIRWDIGVTWRFTGDEF